MAERNESRFAIVATLIAFGLVGGISLLLWALTGRGGVQLQANSNSITANENLPDEVKSRVSAGEASLFETGEAAKQEGNEAIAQGDFANAITVFNSALASEP
ncbi:MAG: hypothetical protein AAFS04_13025, partial [Cyanobacteria bacterium J06631_9]